MWLPLVLLAIPCFLSWLYLRWVRVKNYWNLRNVPSVPVHPIFGSLTFMAKENFVKYLIRIYNDFKSPYVGMWLFWKPTLVINSPELARNILVKDSDIFRDRHIGSGKSDPIGSLNIFTVNEPTWSSVRRRLTLIFTTAKLKHLQSLSSKKSKELCQRIRNEREADKNNRLEIKRVLADFSTDIIGTAAFGVECNATLTGEGPMREVTKSFEKYNFWRGLAHGAIFFWPEVVDLFRFSFFPKSTTDYFRTIFHKVVEQRGGFDTPSQNKDLLDALIKMKQDADKEQEDMSMELIIAQAAIFLQGGFETTSGSLCYCLYELAFNPDVQEKLYQEIMEIKNDLGDADFDTEVLAKATYLNCVLKETLRKYPAMGWMDRISAKEYKVDENLTIPAGTPVYVNSVAMQRDPEYFPEPLKFSPERFLPENEKNIKHFTYTPFGEGPRNCIGMRFAYLNMRFAMAHLVSEFEFRPWPESTKPDDIIYEKNSLFMIPGEFLSIEFVPRN